MVWESRKNRLLIGFMLDEINSIVRFGNSLEQVQELIDE